MAISAIDKELLKYFIQLDEPQKKSLLELIKTFLKSDDTFKGRVNIEQYNRELDEAMERVNKGEFTTLEELEKKCNRGKVQTKSVIDNQAKLQLQQAYIYIKKDSLQNAEKVRNRIIASIKELIKNPEIHAPDKYRLNNDGSYRAFEIYKYRITYHITNEQITVIRIRHTKMNPLEY